MNRRHLGTVVWLRWRLRTNQLRRAGTLTAVLFALLVAGSLVTAVGLLVVGVVAGRSAFGEAPAHAHLLAWGGIGLAVLFFWSTGLLADLQRSDPLSLDRFLHLPVSPAGAFLVNYLGSLFSLTLVVFVPGMVGLAVGLTLSRGPLYLLLLPLAAGFVFALTAVTYQFKGWLAGLMANPRRRRTVVVLLTVGFIAVVQVPNLINLSRPWEAATGPTDRRGQRVIEVANDQAAGRVTPEQANARLDEITRQYEAERQGERQQYRDRVLRVARPAALAFPPGWLPLGAEGLAEGTPVPALLGTAGFALIGAWSLRRAYRTTLRLYTGGDAAGGPARPAASPPAAPPDPARVRMVEWRLPGVSEPVAAVATAALRSLTRAPEAKMTLLTPVIMVVVFGGILLSGRSTPPAFAPPLLAYATGGGLMLIAGLQLLGNQFGYDRAGFRAYVLSPVARRDVLVGKNLAAAPLLLGIGLTGFVVCGAVYPMRADHYPAVLAQTAATYLIVCLVGNGLSILTPIPMAAGSLQPAKVKVGPVLLQLAAFLLMPVFLFPVLIPYGLEVLLDHLDVVKGVPVSLVLSLAVLGLVGLVYRWAVRRQGAWLAEREQQVLEVVTSTSD